MDGFIKPSICFSRFISFFRSLFCSFFLLFFFWCVRSIFPGFASSLTFLKSLVVNDLRRLDDPYFFFCFPFPSVRHSPLFHLGMKETIPRATNGWRMTTTTKILQPG